MQTRLSTLRKDSAGITGLETAIIMIAFIVVASVFAYTVLSAGILSSSQGRAAVYVGIKAAGGAMEIKGSVIAKSLSYTGESLGTGDGSTTLFTTANNPVATGSETVYLAGSPQSRDTNYTITNSTGAVTFISSTVVTGESIGTGDGATLIFGPTASAPIVADSQTVYLDAAAQTEGVDYSIVDATGVVTFGVAPGGAVAVTIDYTSVPPATGVAITIDYEQGGVNEVMFTVGVPLKGSSIDLTITTDSDADGLLSDESPKSHRTIISYIDENQRVPDLAWTWTQSGRVVGTRDSILDWGEKMTITVKLTALSPVLAEEGRFTLEIVPEGGSTLHINRKIPTLIDAIMDLK